MIFFDLDDTMMDHLASQRHAVHVFHREHSDLFFTESADEFLHRWHELTERHLDRYFAGEVSLQESRRARMRELYGHAGHAIGDADADTVFTRHLQHYRDGWTLFDDALPSLRALERRRLGVITNGTADQQLDKLQTMKLRDRFETVVISGDVGFAKPRPEIFAEAVRRAGLPTQACVYIGDKLAVDAEGATAAGMRGVWLDRRRQRTGNETVPVVGSLTEFVELIASWGK